MNSPRNPDVTKVSSFVAGMITQMMDGQGLNVDLLKIGPVIAAGKRLKNGAEGKQVLVDILREVETKHPELWDLLLVGASEALKERIRKAVVPRPEVDVQAEKP